MIYKAYFGYCSTIPPNFFLTKFYDADIILLVFDMKVLIIDSDRKAAEFLNNCLSMLKYRCDIEDSSATGLKAALENDYCCIITETQLSGMDGFYVCSALRKEKMTPIIFISSDKDEASVIRAFGAGADDYIKKPFSVSETAARIDGHITRYLSFRKLMNNKAENSVKIRGLEIHKDSHRVFVNNKEIFMPVKEYDLLLFLAENPNMVFSKEHLLDRVWGIDTVGDSATVTVHIQRIRDKIESENDTYIETVWGAGYRLRL